MNILNMVICVIFSDQPLVSSLSLDAIEVFEVFDCLDVKSLDVCEDETLSHGLDLFVRTLNVLPLNSVQPPLPGSSLHSRYVCSVSQSLDHQGIVGQVDSGSDFFNHFFILSRNVSCRPLEQISVVHHSLNVFRSSVLEGSNSSKEEGLVLLQELEFLNL